MPGPRRPRARSPTSSTPVARVPLAAPSPERVSSTRRAGSTCIAPAASSAAATAGRRPHRIRRRPTAHRRPACATSDAGQRGRQRGEGDAGGPRAGRAQGPPDVFPIGDDAAAGSDAGDSWGSAESVTERPPGLGPLRAVPRSGDRRWRTTRQWVVLRQARSPPLLGTALDARHPDPGRHRRGLRRPWPCRTWPRGSRPPPRRRSPPGSSRARSTAPVPGRRGPGQLVEGQAEGRGGAVALDFVGVAEVDRHRDGFAAPPGAVPRGVGVPPQREAARRGGAQDGLREAGRGGSRRGRPPRAALSGAPGALQGVDGHAGRPRAVEV